MPIRANLVSHMDGTQSLFVFEGKREKWKTSDEKKIGIDTGDRRVKHKENENNDLIDFKVAKEAFAKIKEDLPRFDDQLSLDGMQIEWKKEGTNLIAKVYAQKMYMKEGLKRHEIEINCGNATSVDEVRAKVQQNFEKETSAEEGYGLVSGYGAVRNGIAGAEEIEYELPPNQRTQNGAAKKNDRGYTDVPIPKGHGKYAKTPADPTQFDRLPSPATPPSPPDKDEEAAKAGYGSMPYTDPLTAASEEYGGIVSERVRKQPPSPTNYGDVSRITRNPHPESRVGRGGNPEDFETDSDVRKRRRTGEEPQAVDPKSDEDDGYGFIPDELSDVMPPEDKTGESGDGYGFIPGAKN